MRQLLQQAGPPSSVVNVVTRRLGIRSNGRPQSGQQEAQALTSGRSQRQAASRRRPCVAQATEGALVGGVSAPVARQLRIPVGDREVRR